MHGYKLGTETGKTKGVTMGFEITDLLEAIDEYKEAKDAFDADPYYEYGVGTQAAKEEARGNLNKAFKRAVKAAII